MLRWREIEKVVRIQIECLSDKNDYGKSDKARAVRHCCKKGQQENPECSIIGQPNN